MLGFAVLLGILCSYAGRLWRQPSASGRQRCAAGTGLALIVLLHLGVASLSRVVKQSDLVKLGNTLDNVAATLPGFVDGASHERPAELVLVNAGDFFTIVYPPLIHDYHHGPGKVSWNVLSSAPFEHRLTRSSANTLELESVDGQFLQSDFERLWGPKKLTAGDSVETPLFRVESMEENAFGPTRLAFHFQDSEELESSSIAFLVWRKGGLERLVLPAIGESVKIEQTAGLFGLL